MNFLQFKISLLCVFFPKVKQQSANSFLVCFGLLDIQKIVRASLFQLTLLLGSPSLSPHSKVTTKYKPCISMVEFQKDLKSPSNFLSLEQNFTQICRLSGFPVSCFYILVKITLEAYH